MFFQGYFSSAANLDVQVNVASYPKQRRFQAPLTNRRRRPEGFYFRGFCEIGLINLARVVRIALAGLRLAASCLVCDLKEIGAVQGTVEPLRSIVGTQFRPENRYALFLELLCEIEADR
ncbi:MAG: hypothetical protein QM636_05415 [Rhizobium sp.]